MLILTLPFLIQSVFLRKVLQLLVTANVVPSSPILSIQLVFLCSVLQLLVTANVIPSLPILSTLMMEAIHTSATPVLTRSTRRHIKEDGILYTNRRTSLLISTSSKFSRAANLFTSRNPHCYLLFTSFIFCACTLLPCCQKLISSRMMDVYGM
jgi:hypothetical protein